MASSRVWVVPEAQGVDLEGMRIGNEMERGRWRRSRMHENRTSLEVGRCMFSALFGSLGSENVDGECVLRQCAGVRMWVGRSRRLLCIAGGRNVRQTWMVYVCTDKCDG